MKKQKLAIVIPCFNEKEVIENTYNKIHRLMKQMEKDSIINQDSFICFVDDGSKDNTWDIIFNISSSDNKIHAIKLSRNFGHQNALLAGLTTVNNNCDIVISIDADLQQDIDVIPEMIKKYNNGAEIVFGIRKKRTGDSLLKKLTGILFINLFNILGGNVLKNHADFRLMGDKALKALLEYGENNIFLRGLVTELGFKTDSVEFEQKERALGKTKYTLIKMIKLGYDGITSLTITPLRYLFALGAFSFVSSIIYVCYVFYIKLFTDSAVPGWASIVLPIWVFSSLQLLSIGLIGEYLSRIFLDIKKRPRFIVEKKI